MDITEANRQCNIGLTLISRDDFLSKLIAWNALDRVRLYIRSVEPTAELIELNKRMPGGWQRQFGP